MDSIIETREKTIQTYFDMWIIRDFDRLDQIFSPDCKYQESYGPCYLSLVEIEEWIQDQLAVQKVLKWDIKEMWPSLDNDFIVTWNFTAEEKNVTNFDGVSIVHFNRSGLIDNVREYQSKSEHEYPYHH